VSYLGCTVGKRFRSTIAGSIAAALTPGVRIPADVLDFLESLHSFTLVHDDIVDESPTRRGKPSLWRMFSKERAILYGDYQHAKVFEALTISSQVPDAFRLSLLKWFTKASVRVQEGQLAELDHTYDTNMTPAEYYEVATLKTSSLIELATSIGALWGKATEQESQHLFQFARSFGIAFQIYNDLIDFEPNHGKSTGDDIRSGKMTLPLVFFCQARRESGKAFGKTDYQRIVKTGDTGWLERNLRSSDAFDRSYHCMLNFTAESQAYVTDVVHIPDTIAAIFSTFRNVGIGSQVGVACRAGSQQLQCR
jgi:geranylgeranyl pyrophosphate synthase